MNIGMFATLVAIVERGTLAAAAQQVGTQGAVVGIDISHEMLAQAEAKAKAAEIVAL